MNKNNPSCNSIHKEAAADAWLTPGKFALILGALICASFPQVIAGFETFYFRDFGCFGYPLAFFHRETFWRGELPLWNPYNNCGIPFLAQWNTLTLYPLSLFYLIFPLSWSLGVFCLGHMFLGGMGMYFLARRWMGNNFAASIAGVMFAFNGLTWHALMWPNNSAALGWMPWVILAMELAWHEGGRKIILAGFAGALQMLAGAPEIILLTWVAAIVFWLTEWFRPQTPRVLTATRFFLAVLLVAALSAAQLLPFLDLLSHSQRDTSFSDSGWSMPLTGWANYLVPLFHTFPQKGVFSQYGQFWTSSYYVGIATVALACLAVWKLRDRRTRVLAALAALSVVIALGDHGVVYSIVKHIVPAMGFMRFPIKFVVLATFVLPLLAARGLCWFQRVPDAEWQSARKAIFRIGVIMGIAIVIILIWEWVAPMPNDDRAAVLKNAATRLVYLTAALAGIAALRRASDFKLQRLLRFALIPLCWLDVFTHTPNLSPTIERGVYEPDSVRDYFKWTTELRPGESRAMPSSAAINWINLHAVSDPVADVNGRRLGLFENFNLLDHAAKVDGFYSLELREESRVSRVLYGDTNELRELEDFLTVSRVSNPTNLVDWLSRETAMPMITGGQTPVFAPDDTAAHGIFGPSFDPRQTVYLDESARAQVTASPADVKIIPRSFTAQKLDADVEASASAMIVVAQSYYHNWHAYVDGRNVPLWRANLGFQALEVPAGKHEVRLVYEDVAFRAGAAISLGALIGAIANWLLLGKRSGKNKLK